MPPPPKPPVYTGGTPTAGYAEPSYLARTPQGMKPEEDFSQSTWMQDWWETKGAANRQRYLARNPQAEPTPRTRVGPGSSLAQQYHLQKAAELDAEFDRRNQFVSIKHPAVATLVEQAKAAGVTLSPGDMANLARVGELERAKNIILDRIKNGDNRGVGNVMLSMRQRDPMMAALLGPMVEDTLTEWAKEKIEDPNLIENGISWLGNSDYSPVKQALTGLTWLNEQVRHVGAAATYTEDGGLGSVLSTVGMNPATIAARAVQNWDVTARGAMSEQRLAEIKKQYPAEIVDTAVTITREMAEGNSEVMVDLLMDPNTSPEVVTFIRDILYNGPAVSPYNAGDLREMVEGARLDNIGDIVSTGVANVVKDATGSDYMYSSSWRGAMSQVGNLTWELAADPLNYVGTPIRAVTAARYAIAKLAPKGLTGEAARVPIEKALASRTVAGLETNRSRRYFQGILDQLDHIDTMTPGSIEASSAWQRLVRQHREIPEDILRAMADPQNIQKVNGRRTIDGALVGEGDQAARRADGFIDYIVNQNDQWAAAVGKASAKATKAGETYLIEQAVKAKLIDELEPDDLVALAAGKRPQSAITTDQILQIARRDLPEEIIAQGDEIVQGAIRRYNADNPYLASRFRQYNKRDQVMPYTGVLGDVRRRAVNSIIAERIGATRTRQIVDEFIGEDISPEAVSKALDTEFATKEMARADRSLRDRSGRAQALSDRITGLFASMPNGRFINIATGENAEEVYRFARMFYNRKTAEFLADKFRRGDEGTRRLILAGLIRSGAASKGVNLSAEDVWARIGDLATGSRGDEMFSIPVPGTPSGDMMRATLDQAASAGAAAKKMGRRLKRMNEEMAQLQAQLDGAITAGDEVAVKSLTKQVRRLGSKLNKQEYRVERATADVEKYKRRLIKALGRTDEVKPSAMQERIPPRMAEDIEENLAAKSDPGIEVPPTVVEEPVVAPVPEEPPAGAAPVREGARPADDLVLRQAGPGRWVVREGDEAPVVAEYGTYAEAAVHPDLDLDSWAAAYLDEADNKAWDTATVADDGTVTVTAPSTYYVSDSGKTLTHTIRQQGDEYVVRTENEAGDWVEVAYTPYMDLAARPYQTPEPIPEWTGRKLGTSGGKGAVLDALRGNNYRTIEAAEERGFVTPAIGRDPAVTGKPAETPKLPKALSSAKPKYQDKNLTFASDLDRALFIVRDSAKRSKSDEQYMEWLRQQLPGIDDKGIRARGNVVANAIKARIKETEGDTVSLDRLYTPGDQAVNNRAAAARRGEAAQTTLADDGSLVEEAIDPTGRPQVEAPGAQTAQQVAFDAEGMTPPPTQMVGAEMQELSFGDEAATPARRQPLPAATEDDRFHGHFIDAGVEVQLANRGSRRVYVEVARQALRDGEVRYTASLRVASHEYHGDILRSFWWDADGKTQTVYGAEDGQAWHARDLEAGVKKAVEQYDIPYPDTFLPVAKDYAEVVAEQRARDAAAGIEDLPDVDELADGTPTAYSTTGRPNLPRESVNQLAFPDRVNRQGLGYETTIPAGKGQTRKVVVVQGETRHGNPTWHFEVDRAPKEYSLTHTVGFDEWGEPTGPLWTPGADANHVGSKAENKLLAIAVKQEAAKYDIPVRGRIREWMESLGVTPPAEEAMPASWNPSDIVRAMSHDETDAFAHWALRQVPRLGDPDPEGLWGPAIQRSNPYGRGTGGTYPRISWQNPEVRELLAVYLGLVDGKPRASQELMDEALATSSSSIPNGWTRKPGRVYESDDGWRIEWSDGEEIDGGAAGMYRSDKGYVLTDPDGNVNKRTYPGMRGDIVEVNFGQLDWALQAADELRGRAGVRGPGVRGQDDRDYNPIASPAPESESPAMDPVEEAIQGYPTFDEFLESHPSFDEFSRLMEQLGQRFDDTLARQLSEMEDDISAEWATSLLDDPAIEAAYLDDMGIPNGDVIPEHWRAQFGNEYDEQADLTLQGEGFKEGAVHVEEAMAAPIKRPDGTVKYESEDQEAWWEHGALSPARFMDQFDEFNRHGYGEESMWAWWHTGDPNAYADERFFEKYGASPKMLPDPGKGLPAARRAARIPGEYRTSDIGDPFALGRKEAAAKELRLAEAAVERAKAKGDDVALARARKRVDKAVDLVARGGKESKRKFLSVPWKKPASDRETYIKSRYENMQEEAVEEAKQGADRIALQRYIDSVLAERQIAAQRQVADDEMADDLLSLADEAPTPTQAPAALDVAADVPTPVAAVDNADVLRDVEALDEGVLLSRLQDLVDEDGSLLDDAITEYDMDDGTYLLEGNYDNPRLVEAYRAKYLSGAEAPTVEVVPPPNPIPAAVPAEPEVVQGAVIGGGQPPTGPPAPPGNPLNAPGPEPKPKLPKVGELEAWLKAHQSGHTLPTQTIDNEVYSFPSRDEFGREHAVHMYQTSDYVVIPHMDEIEAFGRIRSTWLGDKAHQGMQTSTDLWSLATLYGYRFAMRSSIEDLMAFTLTGGLGHLPDLQRGRRGSTAIREANPDIVTEQKKVAGKTTDEVEIITPATDRWWALGTSRPRTSRLGMVARTSRHLSDMLHRGNRESTQQFWLGNIPQEKLLHAAAELQSGRYGAIQELIAEAVGRMHFTNMTDGDIRSLQLLGGTHAGRMLLEKMAEAGAQINSGTYKALDDAIAATADNPDLTAVGFKRPVQFGAYKKLALAANKKSDPFADWYWHRTMQAIVRDDGPIGHIFVKMMHDPDGAKKAIADAIRKDTRMGYKERFSLITSDAAIDNFAHRYYEASLPYFQKADGTINEGLRSRFIDQWVDPKTGKTQMRVNWYQADKKGREFPRVSAKGLSRMDRADKPLYVLGREEKVVTPKNEKALMDRPWEWMGNQYARIAREPIFIGNYMSNMRALKPMQDNLAQAIANGRTGKEGAKITDADRASAEAVTARQAQDAAYAFTLNYMDNPANRSLLAWKVRNVARYYRATEDFARRATRLAKNYPDAYYKLAITYQVLEDTGFTYRDENGDMYFAYPANSQLQDVFSALGQFWHGFGSPVAADPFMVGGFVKNIAPSTDPEQWAPTLTGVVTLPLTMVFNKFPALQGLRAATLGGYSTAGQTGSLVGELVDAIMPAGVRRIWSQLEPSERDAALASAGMGATASLIAEGRLDHVYDTDNPLTLEQLKKDDVFAEGQKRAVGIALTKAWLGYTAPASPQVFQNNVTTFAREAGIDSIDALWHQLIEKHQGDYTAAYLDWQRLDPDGKLLPFTVSKTKNNPDMLKGLTGAQPYKEVIDWMRAEGTKDLAEKFPDSYMFLAPQEGAFDWASWGIIKATGFRVDKTEDEMLIDLFAASGDSRDRAVVKAFDEEIAKIDGTTDEGRARISELESARSAEREAIKNENPYWATKSQTRLEPYDVESIRQQFIETQNMLAYMRGKGEGLTGTAAAIDASIQFWMEVNIQRSNISPYTDAGKAERARLDGELAAVLADIGASDAGAKNFIETILSSQSLFGRLT